MFAWVRRSGAGASWMSRPDMLVITWAAVEKAGDQERELEECFNDAPLHRRCGVVGAAELGGRIIERA